MFACTPISPKNSCGPLQTGKEREIVSDQLSLQPFEALRHLIGGLAMTSQTWHCRKLET